MHNSSAVKDKRGTIFTSTFMHISSNISKKVPPLSSQNWWDQMLIFLFFWQGLMRLSCCHGQKYSYFKFWQKPMFCLVSINWVTFFLLFIQILLFFSLSLQNSTNYYHGTVNVCSEESNSYACHLKHTCLCIISTVKVPQILINNLIWQKKNWLVKD